MKHVIWWGCGLLALLWTGGAWATAALLQWAVDGMASGRVAEWAQTVAAWPVPPWAAPWFDAALLQALRDGVAWGLAVLQSAWPMLGAVAAWLVPAVWLVWALGLGLLLALAVVAHVGAGRWQRRRAVPAGVP